MIRKFEGSKATRDLDTDKHDIEGFINPEVMRRYFEYMHKNRFMKDGSVREGDNWQDLFGEDHQSVCMKSLTRHFWDLWLLHRGYEAREDIEDALGGILFNTMAIWLGKIKGNITPDFQTNEKEYDRKYDRIASERHEEVKDNVLWDIINEEIENTLSKDDKNKSFESIEEVLGLKIQEGVYGNKHIWEQLNKIVNGELTEES